MPSCGVQTYKTRIVEQMTGDTVNLTHRMPTTPERVSWDSRRFSRKKGQIAPMPSDVRAKFGAALLTGIQDGEWTDDNGKPFSSDPASPVYRRDWKELILQYFPWILELLSVRCFDGPATLDQEDDGPELEEYPVPELEDAEKN